MSDDVNDTEEQDAPDEGDDEEMKPPIEDEEFADLSAVADEIEESAGAGAEGEGDEDVDDQEDGVHQEAGEDHTRGRPGRGWGDMYVASVTSGLNAIVEEHGKDGAEPLDEQMARDLHLDEAFEEVMEKRGRADMPPEQELLMGTLILAGTVVLSKTDLPAQALAEVGEDA
ncbi:hypothetical protein [Haloplanus pelagicus]|uniref:hypothetical protein n=1 Tax=Haloplanus pelagicus TaxID=2949995 RepID=UPI00203D83DA|nr:hypothetical protein [Haloplanus sp. HW8-1]